MSETSWVRCIGTFASSTNNTIWVIFRSKTAGTHFSNILEWAFWNSKNLRSCCPQTIKKKNTQWRCSIKREERLALRFVHIPYNLLFPSSSEQSNTFQKAAAFFLTTFANVRVVAGRSRCYFTHAMPWSCRSTALLCRGLEKLLSERHGICELA